MLNNNIEYEFDLTQNKYVLCNSKLYFKNLKGKHKVYTEKFLMFDYKLVKRKPLIWKNYCAANDINFENFDFFENSNVYISERTGETVFTFQPFKLELDRILELEKSLKSSTHRIYMDYKKSWITPGLTPLILIARITSEETYLANFDPNIPHDKDGLRKKNDKLLFLHS